MPSSTRPTARWLLRTAASVLQPKIPSTTSLGHVVPQDAEVDFLLHGLYRLTLAAASDGDDQG